MTETQSVDTVDLVSGLQQRRRRRSRARRNVTTSILRPQSRRNITISILRLQTRRNITISILRPQTHRNVTTSCRSAAGQYTTHVQTTVTAIARVSDHCYA